ncbi:MAG: hypothetical protein ABL984_10870 [Pyrinomonadaceae bacterium]
MGLISVGWRNNFGGSGGFCSASNDSCDQAEELTTESIEAYQSKQREEEKKKQAEKRKKEAEKKKKKRTATKPSTPALPSQILSAIRTSFGVGATVTGTWGVYTAEGSIVNDGGSVETATNAASEVFEAARQYGVNAQSAENNQGIAPTGTSPAQEKSDLDQLTGETIGRATREITNKVVTANFPYRKEVELVTGGWGTFRQNLSYEGVNQRVTAILTLAKIEGEKAGRASVKPPDQ